MKPKPFDSTSAAKLENYVRKRYCNQLKNGDLSFYLLAFPYLERKGLGLCQPVTANYLELGRAGFRHKSHIREALEAINGVLCEVEYGTPIKNSSEATRLRRYSLLELMNGEPRRKLIDYTPVDAKKLAEILAARTFTYGQNKTCHPQWNIQASGRVMSAKPNIQGDPPKKRRANLLAGVKPGEVLIDADFKTAEPTVIQDVIGYRFENDPYQTAADLLHIDRNSAKLKVNSLAYHSDSEVSLSFWKNPPAEKVFRPYVEALTAYKEVLWENGKPRGKKRRYVNTLSGRKIEAKRGEASHRGQPLSWQITGTVADIMNAACLKIIELEPSKSWKFCFPEHDAVYVIGQPEHAGEIRDILEAEAIRLKQRLKVRIKTLKNKGLYI